MADSHGLYHLACILDPNHFYDEQPLTDEQIFEAMEYFFELIAKQKFTPEQQQLASDCFTNYKQRAALFDRFKEFKGNPINFWQRVLDLKAYKDLARLAIKVLSVRPHSCDCERMNSVHRAVQTKARNRLQQSKVEKLLRCKCYLWSEQAESEKFSLKDFVDFEPNREQTTEIFIDLAEFEEDTGCRIRGRHDDYRFGSTE